MSKLLPDQQVVSTWASGPLSSITGFEIFSMLKSLITTKTQVAAPALREANPI